MLKQRVILLAPWLCTQVPPSWAALAGLEAAGAPACRVEGETQRFAGGCAMVLANQLARHGWSLALLTTLSFPFALAFAFVTLEPGFAFRIRGPPVAWLPRRGASQRG